MIDWPLSVIGN